MLLVFVPVGIAVELAHIDKTIVFILNAIAIVPLAGLLSYATESVASELGDTIGALMNVTFGNAVELIILLVLHRNLHTEANVFPACMCNHQIKQQWTRDSLGSACSLIALLLAVPFHVSHKYVFSFGLLVYYH